MGSGDDATGKICRFRLTGTLGTLLLAAQADITHTVLSEADPGQTSCPTLFLSSSSKYSPILEARRDPPIVTTPEMTPKMRRVQTHPPPTSQSLSSTTLRRHRQCRRRRHLGPNPGPSTYHPSVGISSG
ncbi:hypothetical protein CONLIGDRAFT_143490 [Coniochaeta ligniaria NRRL 30616]|uniref:Uncharacterized protein n=1 Tax=Coniochaeta ligniaria NRRL 30616 TaxID=1408157 RepID=A0A1J7IPX6_9PEZI|nr:hypothetical protein CONLIGDRAFT_143490 [Coniochaeta ligniaria NRRL 30616]